MIEEDEAFLAITVSELQLNTDKYRFKYEDRQNALHRQLTLDDSTLSHTIKLCKHE